MLLLVPSRLELERLVPEAAGADRPWEWEGRRDEFGERVVVARCGVGLAFPGSQTAALLASTPQRWVVLAGLAGSYDEGAAPVGSLLVGSSVALHGIGVGEGPGHLSLRDAGGALAEEAESAAGVLALHVPSVIQAGSGGILTVAAGSSEPGQAADRCRRHPESLAEDMESWPVARAAGLSDARCTVLRGISNVAGDRDHAGWRIDEAVAVLREAIDALTRVAA